MLKTFAYSLINVIWYKKVTFKSLIIEKYMKLFFKYIWIFIFSIILINVLFVIFLIDDFLLLDKVIQYIILLTILLIESIIIISVIYIYYDKPINELKFLIQKFYVWELKWKDIDLHKSNNPNINYINIFFHKTLNTLKNIKDEFIHGKEIKWEVWLAKEIQWKTLNKKLIKVPWLNIVWNSKPAGEVWGDSYDVIKQWDNYYMYVADATGHWVWAWFIMIMVNTLIAAFSKLFVSWAQIIINTNEILKPRVKANLLMSLLMVRWNDKTKKLYMTWAGHEYLMIYKQKLWKCFKIKSGWVALWMIKNISKLIKEQQISFEENDVLVLYSDWITEAINQPKKDWNEQKFLEDRLQETIEKSPNMKWKNYKTARTVFNNITIELSKFMWYNPVQLDDVTLLTIDYKSEDYNPEDDISLDLPEWLITEWNWK